MNEKYRQVENLPKYIIRYLLGSLGVVILFAIFLLGNEGLYSQDFCWSSFKCYDNVLVALTSIASLIDFLLKILVASVSLFGIYHALNNYLSSIDASRSNIHLSHLNTFKHYLASEIDAYDRLEIKSFNTFKWYNLAFPKSRMGKLDIGGDYIKWIDDINAQIQISNDIVNGATPRGFDYNEHQSRLILGLNKVGIKIPRLPRNDFYELESEIFYLINKVNQEFCFIDKHIFKRDYI
jgi:hypothetical protein